MSDATNSPRDSKPAESAAPTRARAAASWPVVFVLALLAGLLGGGIATYLPLVLGAPANDRLGDVQSTVGRLAASFDAETDALTELRDAIDQAKTRLDSLDMQVSALEGAVAGKANQPGGIVARIAALESGATQSAEALAALTGRVNHIEAAVPADLPQRLDSFALKSGAADLDTRLAKLEAANSSNILRQAASMLALADLSRASQDARPFALELNALAVTAPDDPAVKILTPYATASVPTAEMLARRFPPAARAALIAGRRGSAANFFDRMWNSVLELVAVRRVGNLTGNTTEARLARAQVALDANNLAAAIAETAAVTGPAAPPLAPWLADANARLAVDRAIADMKTRIAHALAATGTPMTTGAPVATGTPGAAAPPNAPAKGTAP